MMPSEWSRLKEILAAALSIPNRDRNRFLSQACRGDEGLRRRAGSLLAESKSAANFLEAPALGEAIAILEETEGRTPASELSIGDRLGRYEILTPLGAGGVGEVYRARDSKLKREVAVKGLPADVAGNQERLARFEREAGAASALSGVHIVAIFDVGREGEVHYIVSELVEGETLRTYIAGGPLPPGTALDFAGQLPTVPTTGLPVLVKLIGMFAEHRLATNDRPM